MLAKKNAPKSVFFTLAVGRWRWTLSEQQEG